MVMYLNTILKDSTTAVCGLTLVISQKCSHVAQSLLRGAVREEDGVLLKPLISNMVRQSARTRGPKQTFLTRNRPGIFIFAQSGREKENSQLFQMV